MRHRCGLGALSRLDDNGMRTLGIRIVPEFRYAEACGNTTVSIGGSYMVTLAS